VYIEEKLMSDADVTRSSAILLQKVKSQFAGIGFQTVEKAVRPQGKREKR
jgi:hypothetical protein